MIILWTLSHNIENLSLRPAVTNCYLQYSHSEQNYIHLTEMLMDSYCDCQKWVYNQCAVK